MPVIGEFHGKFWRSRANPVVAAGTSVTWMYPQVQSVVTSMGSLFGALQPLYERAVWCWTFLRLIWSFDAEQRAVLERVVQAVTHPKWDQAKAAVASCATSPKFHQPEQWVEYGRALKANVGQAQNVFRHVKVVHALRGLQDGAATISNPDAHLLAELAYQAFARVDRRRKVVTH
jgi:hypothetical protein